MCKSDDIWRNIASLLSGVIARHIEDVDLKNLPSYTEGEIDYHDNHSYPDYGLMKVLEESSDAIDMYLHHLPDQLTYSVTYKIATPDDMELMMSSRLEMLKVVNDLNYTYEYSDEIVKGSREYFEKGDHTTIPILPEHKKKL